MAPSSKWLMTLLGIACGVALGGILFNLAGCGNRADGPTALQGLPEEANRM
jgi:hypothetical protein